MKSLAVNRCLALFCLSLLCCLAACNRKAPDRQVADRNETMEVKQMPSEIIVLIGESSARFLKRNPVGVRVNRQPAGLDFYSMDWNKSPHANVKVERGPHSFTVPNVTGIQASEDQGELKAEGFADYTIYSVLSESDSLPHEEARNRIHGILNTVMNAGWTQLIEPGDPRLMGRERLEHTLRTSNLNGLDAAYVPTMSEWMRLADRTPWRFYVDGIYMEVFFSRDPKLMASDKPGAYLLTIELQTAQEYFRRFVDPKDRSKWKTLVPGILKDVAHQREQQEDALKAQGLKIQEDYQNPPLPLSP
jgi:hypothetical protein